MIFSFPARPVAALIGVALALPGAPAQAERAPQARLVHCGQSTCLRLSGHRPQPAAAIRVAGQELAVAGGRDWVATVPLPTARRWQPGLDGVLTIGYFDPGGGEERTQTVLLPPGALGRHVELASLVIRAP